MAVEKMYLANLVGKLEDLDSVLTDLLCSDSMSLTNALDHIEQEGLSLSIPNDDFEKRVDFNYVTTVNKDPSIEGMLKKAKRLQDAMNIQLKDETANYCGILSPDAVEQVYSELETDVNSIYELKRQIEMLNEDEKNYSLVQGLDVRIEELRNMEYFGFRFGRLTQENKTKLRRHDAKLVASVFQVQAGDGNDVFLIIYPKAVEQETDRILRSLNWKDIPLSDHYTGTIEEVLDTIYKERAKLTSALEEEQAKLDAIRSEKEEYYAMVVDAVYTREKTEQLKSYVASGSHYFYITGWVPASKLQMVQEMFSGYDDMIVGMNDAQELPAMTPPTKLKNNAFFRPFEMLVNMYGTPNYKEIDPTSYFGITYMLLFGMMFGDVGQGLVFMLVGWLMSKKTEQFGALLMRIGLASTAFGFLYGSVFSIETLLPALLIRPFQNINTVLVAAIAFGIILSASAYVLNLINCWKRRDIQDGLFGKEGLAGIVLWICLLLVVGSVALNFKTLPVPVLVVIMVLCIVAMLLQQPLTRMIEGKRPLHKDAVGGYYIEGSFAILETLLALVSGTISFIRVGAFAINHAGLFLAFETMGHMIGTSGAMIGMTIAGNILIIGLEGLIVFIQGLRLEFYELFSKYYKGDGVAYQSTTNQN